MPSLDLMRMRHRIRAPRGLCSSCRRPRSDMEVEDPYKPEDNIFGGAQYLSNLLERYNNDMKLALAAYNAGPENVEKYNGIPPFPETKKFIKRVLEYYSQYETKGK